MNNDNLGGIDPKDVLRYLAGGAAGGTALGSIALAVRSFADAKRERERLKDEQASTLVFDLPSKTGADVTVKDATNYEGDQSGSYSKSLTLRELNVVPLMVNTILRSKLTGRLWRHHS